MLPRSRFMTHIPPQLKIIVSGYDPSHICSLVICGICEQHTEIICMDQGIDPISKTYRLE
ncbi:6068_t:CDS:2 [Cetraspora pellucida]|uniref:6068_t:CDS:1 n=1 Tax=Cetraspora pellucida TaxID=1433469 RepID=A0A9N9FVX7_9GLOM|nr:6068_t:CDS:2 [Cetraspora pellucida]